MSEPKLSAALRSAMTCREPITETLIAEAVALEVRAELADKLTAAVATVEALVEAVPGVTPEERGAVNAVCNRAMGITVTRLRGELAEAEVNAARYEALKADAPMVPAVTSEAVRATGFFRELETSIASGSGGEIRCMAHEKQTILAALQQSGAGHEAAQWLAAACADWIGEPGKRETQAEWLAAAYAATGTAPQAPDLLAGPGAADMMVDGGPGVTPMCEVVTFANPNAGPVPCNFCGAKHSTPQCLPDLRYPEPPEEEVISRWGHPLTGNVCRECAIKQMAKASGGRLVERVTSAEDASLLVWLRQRDEEGFTYLQIIPWRDGVPFEDREATTFVSFLLALLQQQPGPVAEDLRAELQAERTRAEHLGQLAAQQASQSKSVALEVCATGAEQLAAQHDSQRKFAQCREQAAHDQIVRVKAERDGWLAVAEAMGAASCEDDPVMTDRCWERGRILAKCAADITRCFTPAASS